MSEESKPFVPASGWLTNGLIPAHTICPFRVVCEVAKSGQCHHASQDHTVDFSCGLARGFAQVHREGRLTPTPKPSV